MYSWSHGTVVISMIVTYIRISTNLCPEFQSIGHTYVGTMIATLIYQLRTNLCPEFQSMAIGTMIVTLIYP